MKRISRAALRRMMPVGTRWRASWPANPQIEGEPRTVTIHTRNSIRFSVSVDSHTRSSAVMTFYPSDRCFVGHGYVELHQGTPTSASVRYTKVV